MRATEFIVETIVDEAKMDPGIKKVLVQKGYKFLGHGQDQDAYLATDGTILKIFGFEHDSRGLSFGQKSFVDFANFCMANPDNPFLPQFGGWNQFEFKGQRYLQIKCERLFDLRKSNLKDIEQELEDLSRSVLSAGPTKGLESYFGTSVDSADEYWHGNIKEVGTLITLLGGEQNVILFVSTIEQLKKVARKGGYRLDLHGQNFMVGSDGELVINDPFYTGTHR